MGSSFTTSSSGTQSTPPAPRETWVQRMSRRSHRRRDPSDPRDGATLRFCKARGLPATSKRAQSDHKHHTGEQEEVDQLTAFRTGVFDSLDARNSSAP